MAEERVQEEWSDRLDASPKGRSPRQESVTNRRALFGERIFDVGANRLAKKRLYFIQGLALNADIEIKTKSFPIAFAPVRKAPDDLFVETLFGHLALPPATPARW
jgi:hypothetical protein